MKRTTGSIQDKDLQSVIGYILRWGVWIAMGVSLLGGIIYLYHHGQEQIHYGTFVEQDHSIMDMLRSTFNSITGWHGRGIIMLGIMLLFATPLVRLLFSLIGFILEKDRLYIIITLIVLAIIFTSIRGGLG